MSDDDGPRFAAAPPARIELPGRDVLVRCRPALAGAAALAINESLDHLQPWMAWAAEPATEASLSLFFAISESLWDERRDFGFSILRGDDVVGGCGLHGRLGPAGLEIGYWVHVDHVRRGLATAAARALTDAAFGIDGIEVVRIQCEVGNEPSSRVPARLGFTSHGAGVPDDGPCAGRPTERWTVERAAWMAAGVGERP